VVKGGRTIGLVECDVTDTEGRLVARAASTCMTLRETHRAEQGG
jgi:acyl-coenzyme A thioesterase PaaI-like protein